jgi:pimeloyl-ACP methyl ester carboxylesterase
MGSRDEAENDKSIHLPRVLCLHGGGTNSRIFRAQCRRLTTELKSELRFVFAEAPFSSEAGSDVVAVYEAWGPFKRWLRWLSNHPEMPPEETIQSIHRSLKDAMDHDNDQGATGEWVALLGFSQGAKLCASLLYDQQLRQQRKLLPLSNYRFGVLIAGSAPFIILDLSILDPNNRKILPDASQSTYQKLRSSWTVPLARKQNHETFVIYIPTLHVHGIRDPGLHLHRQLFDEFCDNSTKTLIQWDGDHRVPLNTDDVSRIADRIRDLAKVTGVS